MGTSVFPLCESVCPNVIKGGIPMTRLNYYIKRFDAYKIFNTWWSRFNEALLGIILCSKRFSKRFSLNSSKDVCRNRHWYVRPAESVISLRMWVVRSNIFFLWKESPASLQPGWSARALTNLHGCTGCFEPSVGAQVTGSKLVINDCYNKMERWTKLLHLKQRVCLTCCWIRFSLPIITY